MADLPHQGIQRRPKTLCHHWAMMVSVAHPRLALDLMDGTISGGVSTEHICHRLHGKLDATMFVRKIARYISKSSVNVRFIDRAPECAVFLERLYCLADKLFKQGSRFFLFPAVHFIKPQRIGEMM